MAQIIKHRRGSLEAVSSATKRAGELLVVTGSAGISAANGNTILFVGIDGSTVTPANKILQGTTTPDLTGATYDTSIDGIPYYNTAQEKLFIVNKGGNVEVKATAQTGGTGIVSGSSQVTYASISSIPAGIISSSAQVNADSITNFDANVKDKLNADGVISGSAGIVPLLPTGTVSGSSQITYASISSIPAGIVSGSSQILGGSGIFSGSSQVNLASVTGNSTTNVSEGTNLYYTDARVKTKLDAETVISGSSQVNLASVTGNSTTNVSEGTNLYYTDARVKTKLNAETVISGSSQILGGSGIFSGSSQVNADSITNFDENVKAKLDADTVVSGSSQINLASVTGNSTSNVSEGSNLYYTDARVKTKLNAETVVSGSSQIVGILGALNTFSASEESKNSTLASYTSSLVAAFTASGGNVTFNGTTTIKGDLFVQGTTTQVDSTTINLADNVIQLNAAGTSDGGLIVRDATGASTTSGSFLWDVTNDYWKAGKFASESKVLVANGDSVVSGSSQINADSITNFDTNVKDKLNADTVVSGSSQITFSGISSLPTLVSGSSQIVLNDADKTGFDTDDVSEGSRLYYTDARVKTKLNAETVVSGSSQINLASVTGNSTTNVSEGTNLYYTDARVKTKLDAETVVSGSSQITYASISSIPAGIVSGSAQVTPLLPTGVISGSAQTVASLASQNVSFGVISGSSLNVTGNVNIDGNLTLGGTITIGDTTSDNLVVNADLSSSIIPNDDNSFDLGSTSKRYRAVHATDVHGAIKATNGIVSGSSQITYANISSISAGIVSGSSQLDSTTINLAKLTSVEASGSFSGSFKGDGSNLTGLVTDLRISGSTGNDVISLLTDALLVTGSNSISTAVTNNVITITADNASTSVKGVASFASANFAVTSGNVTIKANGVTAATLNSDVAGTGLSLDNGDNSLKVDYGSTSGTAVEGNTSLTVQGTAGEIEVSGGSVTLGSGGTVTIGLPDNVTISGSLTANGNVTLGNSTADSVTIAGNLYVQGTTTTVDSTTVQIGDNIIELNGSGAANGGLLVKDATGGNTTSGSFLWDTTNDFWKAGAAGSEKEVARFNASPTSGSVQVVGASGLFVNSQISDDAVKVTIGTDLVITGLTANSFVVSNGSKKLISVTPSNAGDLIQWNGSSFIASNELDGGTF